jgi:hypothetical protein
VLHVEPEDLKVLNAVAEDVDDAEKPVTLHQRIVLV